MAAWFGTAGCDAIHTLDLPDGNRTTDENVNDMLNGRTAYEGRRQIDDPNPISMPRNPLSGRPTGSAEVVGIDFHIAREAELVEVVVAVGAVG